MVSKIPKTVPHQSPEYLSLKLSPYPLPTLNSERPNWNTSLEAGAGWVIESKAFSLYIDEYKSVKEPIKKGSVLIPRCSIDMETNIDIQNLARAIVKICTFVGKTEKTDEQVIDFIKTTKLYKEQIFN